MPRVGHHRQGDAWDGRKLCLVAVRHFRLGFAECGLCRHAAVIPGYYSSVRYSQSDSTGIALSVDAVIANKCISSSLGSGSSLYSCSGNTMTASVYNSNDCNRPTATSSPSQTLGTCSSGSIATCSSTVCFHETTQITYKGAAYSMQTLAANAECRIPHVVIADGVSITTTCSAAALRLTGDHLVFTSRGLVAAATVAVNDVLFADMDETKKCTVTSTATESGQKYFGLNCRLSTVLANSLKTSTFGRFHAIPSLWMSWGAAVIGVDRASRWGDAIANFLA